MDNSSMSSEVNYAEHVAAQNNMEVEVSYISFLLDSLSYNFTLSPSQSPCISHEKALNPVSISETNMSIELSSPMVIPYSTNVPANPSL